MASWPYGVVHVIAIRQPEFQSCPWDLCYLFFFLYPNWTTWKWCSFFFVCIHQRSLCLILKKKVNHFISLVTYHNTALRIGIFLFTGWLTEAFDYNRILFTVNTFLQLPALCYIREFQFILRLISSFFTQEMDLIREQLQHLVSLPMWICLLPVFFLTIVLFQSMICFVT